MVGREGRIYLTGRARAPVPTKEKRQHSHMICWEKKSQPVVNLSMKNERMNLFFFFLPVLTTVLVFQLAWAYCVVPYCIVSASFSASLFMSGKQSVKMAAHTTH